MTQDIFHIRKTLKIRGTDYAYYSLSALQKQGYGIDKLPFSIRILLENALRNFDDFSVTKENIETLLHWEAKGSDKDIPFKPARVLMQDFTGVPAVVDIAALRAEVARKGKDPNTINPLIPVDLIIDHSVQVDFFGTEYSFARNMDEEYRRNNERCQFLKWAQNSFDNFSVVTATDLVLTIAELLRKFGVVGKFVEVFGTGLSNLSVPDRATIGNMSPEFGCTITYFPTDDKTLEYMRKSNRSEAQITLVETYCKTNMLWREHEDKITYTDVLELDLSAIEPSVAGPKRPQDKILLKDVKNKFIELLDSSFNRKYISKEDREIEKSITRFENEGGDLPVLKAGSKPLKAEIEAKEKNGIQTVWITRGQEKFMVSDGAVVIAAITSCTNTSNPFVMIGAGLVARKAREHGIDVKPWVKTSLAPGSKVVTDYLEKANLMKDLEALQFHLVGYGCTSCIGNSGPLSPKIIKAVDDYNLIVVSVLSGNRNFEARIHPQVKMNFLMSPMLVVAYAIAGRVDIDLINEPISYDSNQEPVFLKDIWPTDDEINEILSRVLSPNDFAKNYGEIFEGNKIWRNLKVPSGKLFEWNKDSTYIKEVPFFQNITERPEPLKDIQNARALLVLGDSVTTDHISPAGAFSADSPAGKYLLECGVEKKNFNSYGSRRGNDEVMVRGTFANVRIKNKLTEKEGGYTRYLPSGEEMSVYEASVKYKEEQTPLLVLAGKEYGSGSSRDWAAKGTFLLGIKAVLAESYERIHRSNLVRMGVLPLQYKNGENAEKIGLTGKEVFSITGVAQNITPLKEIQVIARNGNGKEIRFQVIARLDSLIEIEYYRNGGILQYVLRQFLKNN